MIHSIRNRIYWVGLFPLALLAIALTAYNGATRLQQLESEIVQLQGFAVDLLQGPAQDALVIGNVAYFEQRIKELLSTSERVQCVQLYDLEERLVSQAGQCNAHDGRSDLFAVQTSTEGFSDVVDVPAPQVPLGALRVSMNRSDLDAAVRLVWLQVGFSVFLVLLAAITIGLLLKRRLVEPIQAIDRTLKDVSDGDLSARVDEVGDDEVGLLSSSINDTIAVIERNVAELQLRRDEATRALDDADSSALARDGLVRSLAEDLETPLDDLNQRLTDLAVQNQDPALRVTIRELVLQLRNVQTNFVDLVEIAQTERPALNTPVPRDLTEILREVEETVSGVADERELEILFSIEDSLTTWAEEASTGLMLELDSGRIKKALVGIIGALSRSAFNSRVSISLAFAQRLDDRLFGSITVSCMLSEDEPPKQTAGLVVYSDEPPSLIQWSEGERRIADYLLGAIGFTMTYSYTPGVKATVHLEGSCRYLLTDDVVLDANSWLREKRVVRMLVVSEDDELSRWTQRTDMANHALELATLSDAIENPGLLVNHDVIFIDFTEDVAGAVSLADVYANNGIRKPLVAICPSGTLNNGLVNRLNGFGFNHILQKPIRYSQLLEVVRSITEDDQV